MKIEAMITVIIVRALGLRERATHSRTAAVEHNAGESEQSAI